MSDTNLRTNLIKLAHSRPELRAELLPLLATGKTAQTKGTQKDLPPDILQTLSSLGSNVHVQDVWVDDVDAAAAKVFGAPPPSYGVVVRLFQAGLSASQLKNLCKNPKFNGLSVLDKQTLDLGFS